MYTKKSTKELLEEINSYLNGSTYGELEANYDYDYDYEELVRIKNKLEKMLL